MASHRAWAEIDLGAIGHNVEALSRRAPDSELMAVVKADGYGHGLVRVAQAARGAGAQWLGVALLSEALALRTSGDTGRILAWLPTPGDAFAECVAQDVDLSLAANWMLDEAAAAARAVGRPARVHLKVDTGLGRSGVTNGDWQQFVERAKNLQDGNLIEVVAIWSHLAYADSPHHPTISDQLTALTDAADLAAATGIEVEHLHLANSAATLALPETHFSLVRPGIAVYGISPGPDVGSAQELGLRPAMRLAARLVLTKRLPRGHGVSYAHQFVAPRDINVGLVPLGYADGIFRSASNRGPVLAGGRLRQVAGRVCMDQFVIDLDQDELVAGDEVVLFGDPGNGEPTADDWAVAAGTIAYEVVTTVGPRVPRIYLES